MLLLLLASAFTFTDVAGQAGLSFKLDHAPTADKQMIETMAGGLAAFDYDGDGLTDLFFTNGAALPSMDKSAPRYWNRLYRNEGNWKFRDVTEAAGIQGKGYSMGAAVGDFDGDGQPDLFAAGVYGNILYRNLGGGKFADVTAASGITSDRWSVTAGWFDYDNDGRLDLLVVNYSHIDPRKPRFCGDSGRKLRVYCHPKYFEPVGNQLYRNLGNGKFADVSVASGIASHRGRGMGIAFGDHDADGRVDAFVTNDNLPNFLYRNAGGGKFEETALLAGVALLDSGKPVASMGVDWRDFDRDGRADIAVTALASETFPLFQARAGGLFTDATHRSRLATLAARKSGWGVTARDFDNDGWPDLFTANSHVNDIVEQFEKFPYKEANSLFRNLGDGTFADESAAFSGAVRAHRGAVAADFDNDGRLDIAVTALGEPAELWRNTTAPMGQWLRVQLTGRAAGARVTFAGQTITQHTAVSYSSSVDAGLHFGGVTSAGPLTIAWPSGTVQRMANVEPGRVLRVEEGK